MDLRKQLFKYYKLKYMSEPKATYNASNSTSRERKKHAASIIKNHIVWSMGAGFIPVPIADLFAVSAVQLDMIRQLAHVYEVDFKETEGKALITSITGSSIARLGAEAVKFIPGIGTVMGGVTMSVLSGASTYALGQVFRRHFETGGTFLDFEPQRVKKFYKAQFEKGKKVARDLRQKQEEEKEQKVEHKEGGSGHFDRLQKLAAMKNDGLITDEEYEKMKQELFDEMS